jgi:hypothetical protein
LLVLIEQRKLRFLLMPRQSRFVAGRQKLAAIFRYRRPKLRQETMGIIAVENDHAGSAYATPADLIRRPDKDRLANGILHCEPVVI